MRRSKEQLDKEFILFFRGEKKETFWCARVYMDLGMQGSGRTCRALMKLLLRSMDASSTVVGPALAPATPPQAPAAGRQCCGGCIPLVPSPTPAAGVPAKAAKNGHQQGKEAERGSQGRARLALGGRSGVERKEASDASPTPSHSTRAYSTATVTASLSPVDSPRVVGRAAACACCRRELAVVRGGGGRVRVPGPRGVERPQRWL